MTTPATANSVQDELDEPSFPIVYVTDLLKAFVKAVRAHQLYLPNNPMHARSLQSVRDAFATLWQHTDELELQDGLVGRRRQHRWPSRNRCTPASRATGPRSLHRSERRSPHGARPLTRTGENVSTPASVS